MAVPRKTAEYLEQVLPEYRGNPLIEALPDILSSEEAMHLLRRRARYDESERFLAAKYRMHCLGRLAHEYYQPLPQHFIIESKISVCIRQGYLNRNPMERGYVLMANEMYAAMRDRRREYAVPGYHPNASGFTIIGVSGVGKSTAVESVLNLYPQVIEHREYGGKPLPVTQLVYLKIDCPHNGQLGGLCYGFFEEIDRVLGTDYYDQYKRARITIDSMMILMKRIAHEYSLGLLVVDEVQHLSQAKSGSEAMLNFFVTLVNTIGVPVILIGTSKATPILQGEFRQARRGSGQGDLIWNRMEKGRDWELFIRTMWKYQWTRDRVGCTGEMLDMMYQETQGIVVLAVVLYALVQEEAILGEKETFHAADIRTTAKKRMALVQPMIEAIRSNDRKRIEQYADITTIILDQFDREHPVTDAGTVPGNGKVSAEKVLLRLQEENLPFLLRIGASPGQAEELIEKAYRILKKDDGREILAKAYELFLKEKTAGDREPVPGAKEEGDLRTASDPGSIPAETLSAREEW